MKKILIIIQREVITRVSKKSFIILTLLIPFIAAAVLFVPLWLSGFNGDETKEVVVIDHTGQYAPTFTDIPPYKFVRAESMRAEYRNTDSIFAVLTIDADLNKHPQSANLYSSSDLPPAFVSMINGILSEKMRDDLISAYKIPNLPQIIASSNVKYDIKTLKWSGEGAQETSSTVSSVVGIAFTILIYMFILIYGTMVMQSVLEEKTNRIVEIIVSSVKPFQLMMGKIIGIALVGLTQLVIWAIMFSLIIFGAKHYVGSADAVLGIAGVIQVLSNMNLWSISILFIAYFLGGYLLFASIYAAVGASVNAQEDTQQFVMPITLILLFALYAGFYSSQNPDGPLAFWASVVPFTSPIVMMMRLPFNVPVWQILLSLALLFATAVVIVWGAGQIYRVGILLYGKKPTLREMLRWIRYK